MDNRTQTVSNGLGFGAVFAMILSWTTWHSFWWTLLHGFFGWLYVIYYFLIANYDQIL